MPERIDIGDGVVLERATITHAAAVAGAVGESLEHLRPFLPWADEENARQSVQHNRLVTVTRLWNDGREYQYAITTADPTDDRVIGMISVMRNDRWHVGPDAVEIGYWVHVDWCNRGIATRASRALAAASLALDGVERVVIAVDAVNSPSNAIPRKLGFAMEKVVEGPPSAPGESGRMQIWVQHTPPTESDAPGGPR
ncbi:MAG: GNAT family N-acetyltransferase [Acidimicrobiia bacterium]